MLVLPRVLPVVVPVVIPVVVTPVVPVVPVVPALTGKEDVGKDKDIGIGVVNTVKGDS